MRVFTVIGVLWFWMLCFEIGRLLAWLTDEGWAAVVALFYVIVGTAETERMVAACMASLGVQEVDRG